MEFTKEQKTFQTIVQKAQEDAIFKQETCYALAKIILKQLA